MNKCNQIASIYIVVGLLLVATDAAQAQETSRADEVRGVIRPVQEAWISSDLGMQIEKMPFKEGDTFKSGDLLISYDCSPSQAQLQAANAKTAAESVTWKNNRELRKKNAIGQYDVDLAKARVDQAAAESKVVSAQLEKCKVRAPFDGAMSTVGARLYETPERGAKVMLILNVSKLEVEMLVPSTWLTKVTSGAKFKLSVDETGEPVSGEIVRVAPLIESVSQTVKVVGLINAPPKTVKPGMSGNVTFEF